MVAATKASAEKIAGSDSRSETISQSPCIPGAFGPPARRSVKGFGGQSARLPAKKVFSNASAASAPIPS
ncbi:hypothetical protein STA1M1_22400 [Sinisalibacter aestuarii]|uniref:Uncharacterized protein n=1 Tax=Sinisalibacter aestuarii TaxID=2949426 RepID=A0ABQ5LVI5_9RHOB|nr:hypothetical protein STA1M1_22400 [Sinisalibacter aestuarii]